MNHTNPNREFSHDCFELGVIMLRCIFGDIFDTVLEILVLLFYIIIKQEFTLGDELFSRNEFDNCDIVKLSEIIECDKLGSNLKISENLSENYCCLIHQLLGQKRIHRKQSYHEQLMSKDQTNYLLILRYREIMSKMIRTKYDPTLINQICWMTRFDYEDRCHPEAALTHQYFSGDINIMAYPLSFLHFEELLTISPDAEILKKKQITGDDEDTSGGDGMEINDRNVYLEKICNALTLMFTFGERWFNLDHNAILSPRFTKQENFGMKTLGVMNMGVNSPQIRDLAKEMGCHKEKLWIKLNEIIKEVECKNMMNH